MQITCPCCHARFGFEAAFEDDAARELMMLLAQIGREVSRPLVAYLGLFRTRTRALGWDRALKLAREVCALGEHAALGAALSETVEAMRAKQSEATWTPLSNHNYLKRVLETVTVRGASPASSAAAERSFGDPQSKTGQALAALERRKRGS